ncbi:MAG: chemotaxis protein CheA [Gammaproteobacteria bacterium]|nr:chemotaxis protein CheA [Gammaproteobacteria bacterium]
MPVDMAQFHQVFFEESFEGLDTMEAGLIALNCGAPDLDAVNAIFRAAHSIKGGSATFGFADAAGFTHSIEALLDEMRAASRSVTRQLVDLLLISVDCLRGMLTAAREHREFDAGHVGKIRDMLEEELRGTGPGRAHSNATEHVVEANSAVLSGWAISFKPKPHLLRSGNDPVRMFRELSTLGELSVTAETTNVPSLFELCADTAYLSWRLEVRGKVSRQQIADIFDWVEGDCELTIEALPIAAGETAKAQLDMVAAGAAKKTGSQASDIGSIRVSTDKIDALVNMVGELVITQSMLSQLGADFEISRLGKLVDGLAQLERNTRELQESIMRIRMVPISFAFQRFPRMVRDISEKLDKQVDLKFSGEQTELDKTLMEKIGDPLVHLVRNALDHGIEPAAVRTAAGKPEQGQIRLNAYHRGGSIVIEVSDDGAGLNTQKILAKARQRGLVGREEKPSDEAVRDLIFLPGFSTADVVSDVSGRGVGMDVVRKNITDLGGRVEVSSQEGTGSTFTIRLPLTLAILDGQLVRVGREIYIIPLVSIVESVQLRREMVKSVVGRGTVCMLRDEYIPIVRLCDLFSSGDAKLDVAEDLLVVIEADGRKLGLRVAELLGQQQVVIKSLESNFHRVDGIFGATILGDGTVALILDVPGLITLSRRDSDAVSDCAAAVGSTTMNAA